MVVEIGTSGWQYRDWKRALYLGVPQRAWLERYAETFRTVEVNNAFYRLPERSTFAGWRQRTPDDFVVAVKASRYLTHIKRLVDPAEPVQRLMDRAAGLGDKLGPVLLQLPPSLRVDVALLDDCLAAFPRHVQVAVEPRHSSWWTDEVAQTLAAHNATLCWADRRSRAITPLWRTADWGYLRMHEGAAADRPRYGERALRHWAERIAEAWPDGPSWVYFNNDPHAAAIRDAIAFAAAARRTGLETGRVGEPSALPEQPDEEIERARTPQKQAS
jgi:uncharacterized protein YecE (DUF72 family)